jgi:two-component system, chemotaxis family, sensor kinase CheA
VLLCLAEDAAAAAPVGDAVPVLRLRTAVAATGPEDDTVYRYDRQALLDALAQRVGGRRA